MQPSTAAPPRHRPEIHPVINARQQDGEIHVDQVFPATPSQVFQAWLDPALAGRWLFATASRPMTRVAIDARVGGRFRFADDSEAEERGRYLDIQPARHLAFSLARPGARVGSTVTVQFTRHDFGCLLSLTHTRLPSHLAAHTEGRWTGMLYGLGLLLDTEDSPSGEPR